MRTTVRADLNAAGSQLSDLIPTQERFTLRNKSTEGAVGDYEYCHRQFSLTEMRRRDRIEILETIIEGQDDGTIRQSPVIASGLDVLGQRDDVVVRLQIVEMAEEKL